jgi:hypothetical protein
MDVGGEVFLLGLKCDSEFGPAQFIVAPVRSMVSRSGVNMPICSCSWVRGRRAARVRKRVLMASAPTSIWRLLCPPMAPALLI